MNLPMGPDLYVCFHNSQHKVDLLFRYKPWQDMHKAVVTQERFPKF